MLIVRHHGHDAREALWVAVDAAKADDALAPVTVAAPSPFASLSLRRLLATRPGHLGLVNVRFLPLARIAELLGAPSLAATGRRPLTPALRAAAIRAALAHVPGSFAGVAHHPATERSLDRTFREVRTVNDAALERVATRSVRAADVVALYRRFRTTTEAFYDVEDLLEAGARAVDDRAPSLADLGAVVVHVPDDLSRPESELVQELARAGRVTLVLGLTGDVAADAPTVTLADRLRAELSPNADPPLPLATIPTGTAVVSAPEPDDEVAETVRGICRRLEAGAPLHRVAVLYRASEPYARIVHEQLMAAGVPINGPAARTLADSVAGRTLLGALALPDLEYGRDAIIEWLASAPIIDAGTGDRVPTARWDTLSRRANVVAGAEQWQERLERLADQMTLEAETRAAGGDEEGAARRRGDSDEAARLRTFVAELGQVLEPPAEPTWATLAGWVAGLLVHALGAEQRLGSWPEPEAVAYRKVRERVGGLAAISEVHERVDLAEFRRALVAELDVAAGPIGRFGTGVFVGPVRDAVATSFDSIFVLGMNEGSFPPRPRDDALIPDRERLEADPSLPLRSQQAARERREYLAALAAAPERVLSYSRADSRGQRKLRPSRWLLETASALHGGPPLYADDLDRLGAAPWLSVVESFEAALAEPDPPGSSTEYDLAALLEWQRADRAPQRHPFAIADRALEAGFATTGDRRGSRLSSFDGLVGPLDDLAPSPDRPVSPTSLEDWATCPFRYLLRRVLGLHVLSRPEELTDIEGRVRGSLVHAVLASFIESAPPRRDPKEPWTTAERAGLRAIAEQACDEAEAQGLTGKTLLWRLTKRRILRDLDAALDADEEYRAELGVVPVGVEASFGIEPDGPPPVPVDLGGDVRVAFRGVIDRVDRAPDGSHLAVVDYKTGSPDEGEGLDQDPVLRGTKLQLAVYALAARAAYGEVPVRAAYWFTRDAGAYPRAGFELDDDNLTRVHEVLRLAIESIGAGLFPARPGEDEYFGYANCRYCEFDALCPVDRAAAWERKRNDPRIAAYVELAESPESGAGTDGGS